MRVLFMAVLAAVLASGCATYGGLRGFEAAGVVAGNQALVNALGVQTQMALQPGYTMPGYGNVPVCRIQDLADLPQVNQPVLVRVGKAKGHQIKDILYGAAAGGGLGLLADQGRVRVGDYNIDRGMLAGVAIGAGGAGLWTSHEQELCLFLPVARP